MDNAIPVARDRLRPAPELDWPGIGLCIGFAGVLFFADMLTPARVLDGVLYPCVVLAAAFIEQRRAIYAFAAVCTGLIALGWFVGSEAQLVDRAAAATTVWVAAVVAARLRRDRDDALRARRSAESAHRELATQARVDHLTGVANRRRFDEQLAAEYRRAQRVGMPLSLVLIDIDHFKSLNDSAGHQAGDTCLAEVARTLAGHVRRPSDFVARYGGEEFALLLPGSSAEGALARAETLRAAVAGMTLKHAHAAVIEMTVSAGVATVHPGPDVGGTSALLAAADRALYEAKRRGRNRVCAAERAASAAPRLVSAG